MAWFKRSDPATYMPPAQQQQQQEQPPQYVPVAQFTAAMEEVKALGSKFDQFAGMVAGAFAGGPGSGQQTRTAPQPEPEPAIVDVTDDEYNQAVLQGDAAKIAIRTQAIVERSARALRKEYDGKIGILQTQGMGALDQVNLELGQQALNGMPYYQLLKKDVDEQLASVPVQQRTPQMRQWIYDRTVGANLDKIKAFDAAETARIAKEREELDPPGRQQQRDAAPTAETVFGDTLLKPNATWHGGGQMWAKRSPDAWAKSRYGVENINQAAVFATNVMAVDDCPECFVPIVNNKCSAKCVRMRGAA